ncbi:MAG: hypothetical protein KDJ38_00315 [Gammaproteobacteria bacterium]|nr:hypothetical protein [Gammaproteobacteria bacterium]
MVHFGRRVREISSKATYGPIGFDLGRSSVRAVQVQSGPVRPTLKAAIYKKYPCARQELFADPGLFREFVRSAMDGQGFNGRKIVTCTPAEHLRLLTLEYPVSDQVPEAQVILELVQNQVKEDISELVIDYIPSRAPGESGKRTALVAIANLQKQIEFLEMLRGAGLSVAGVEIGPIAIRRLVEKVSRIEETPNILVVNCGTESTYLTVTSGRRLMLDRGVKFGERNVVEKIAAALQMTPKEAERLLYGYGVDSSRQNEELLGGMINSRDIVGTILGIVTPAFHELTREIEKIVAYARAQLHGADIQQIYLLGSLSRWPGAERFLASLMHLPVKVLNPFESFECGVGLQSTLDSLPVSGMAVATGCALSELR